LKILYKGQGQPDLALSHLTPESPKRGLMSGETLRATRQQLRLLCASDFCFFALPYSRFFLIKSQISRQNH
jgi:hypothetical protein